MRANLRKLLSTLFVFAMAFSLLYALPMTASALSDDDTIDLGDLGYATSPNWSYDQATHTISVTGNVEITGHLSNSASALKILFCQDVVTVTWKTAYNAPADLTHAIEVDSTKADCIFSVALGGSIIATGDSDAIRCANTNIEINGGTVTASHGHAISGGNITIISGTLTSSGINGKSTIDCSWLSMHGGTVHATGTDGIAVKCDSISVVAGSHSRIEGNVEVDSRIDVLPNANLTVTGNVNLIMDNGAICANGPDAAITIIKSVTFEGDITDDGGIQASEKAEIYIGEDVTFEGKVDPSRGIYAEGESYICIDRSVEFSDEVFIGIEAYGSAIDIIGDVTFKKDTTTGISSHNAAGSGSVITISGKITFDGDISYHGIHAYTDDADGIAGMILAGDIRFNGDIHGDAYGILALGLSNADSDVGIIIEGVVLFEGEIQGCGISAQNAMISAFDDITAKKITGRLVYAVGNPGAPSYVDIYGSVTGECNLIEAFDASEVTVFGDLIVTGTSVTAAVECYNADVSIFGDLRAEDVDTEYFAGIQCRGGSVGVDGDIVLGSGLGAWSINGGKIIIEGDIYAPTQYVRVGYADKGKAAFEPVSSSGMEDYREYKDADDSQSSDHGNFVWVRCVYTVVFHPNGAAATVTPEYAETNRGGTLTSLLPTPSWSGYKFLGWFTQKVGGDLISQDRVYTAHTIIYAHWTPETQQPPPPAPPSSTYTITFDANGGTGTMTSEKVAQGGKYNIKENKFTRAGFMFAGWNTKADGTGTAYPDKGAINSVTQNMTLYARWIPALESEKHIRYILGYPDGSVKPEKAITRAEAVTIFYRLLTTDDKDAEVTTTFTDVKSDDWFYHEVAYFEKNGLIVDSTNGKFRPNEPITRAEYAALASGFDKLDTDAPNVFPDVPDDHWAVGYINSAAKKGWVEGFEDGTFKPEGTLTRAQLVTIVNRMLKRSIKLENIPASAPKYTDLKSDHWAYCALIEASVDHTYTRNPDNSEIWN